MCRQGALSTARLSPWHSQKNVDAMMMKWSTSDQPLQERQTVETYRALEDNNHWKLNRSKEKSLISLLPRPSAAITGGA